MASSQPKKRVLFVCSHNSNRSVAAHAVARKLRPDLEVQSAGTAAAGTLNPVMISALESRGFSTEGLYSKVSSAKLYYLDTVPVLMHSLSSRALLIEKRLCRRFGAVRGCSMLSSGIYVLGVRKQPCQVVVIYAGIGRHCKHAYPR